MYAKTKSVMMNNAIMFYCLNGFKKIDGFVKNSESYDTGCD